jgi:hypothetical protein
VYEEETDTRVSTWPNPIDGEDDAKLTGYHEARNDRAIRLNLIFKKYFGI